MPDFSENPFGESAGSLIQNWGLDSTGSVDSIRSRSLSVPTQIPRDVSFNLGDPDEPGDLDNRAMTQTQTMARSKPQRKKSIQFPTKGDTIGGFRIVSELGRGAFARVYLAEQIDLAGRLVALKVAEALGDEPQALARLQHTHIVPIHSVHDDPETGLRLLCMPYVGGANLAQVLERSGARLPSQASGRSLIEALDHVGGRCPSRLGISQRAGSMGFLGSFGGAATRGIGTPTAVRSILGKYWARLPWWKSVTGALDSSAAPMVTSEVIDERDQPARRFLRSHTYVQAAVWIIARLAEGLEHAHARGILHRDLKPSNILIASDGTPMLLDFNLAADMTVGDVSEEGARAMLGGTLPYMAPEHLDAFNPQGTTKASAVDQRSDIYALGLILFELVAGRHPFDDPPPGLPVLEVVTRMTAQRRAGAPSARSVNPAIPPSLNAIVAKCLHPLPERRYTQAAELAEDLRRFLDDFPNRHAPEPSIRERCRKWFRRHPEIRGAGPIAAMATVLFASLGVAAWGVSDYAEGARAKLKRNTFRDEFVRCQLLLNTASGPASHRAEGITRAEKLLDLYGVQKDPKWFAGPDVQRLAPKDERSLREEMSELILLLTRARVAQAGRNAPEPERRKVLQSGVQLLEQAEKSDPRPSSALYETRAKFLSALGESDRARADRERAERFPPSSARDFYLRGTTRAASQQLDAAEEDLAKAVALDSRRFWAWFVLGLCHYDSGRFGDAVGDFSVCTTLAPEFAWPYLNRGLALAADGRLTEARASYDRALALSPNFIEALVDRALACLELNDPSQAEIDLDKAVSLGRHDAGTLAARAEARNRLGHHDRAEEDFRAALRTRPGDPSLLAARGMSRLTTDADGAAKDFREALAKDPRNSRAHYGLALLMKTEKPADALKHANQALDSDPRAIDALRVRAVLLGRMGDPAAAAAAAQLVRQPSAQNLYNAGCALALMDQAQGKTDHIDLAREYVNRAIELGFPGQTAEQDPDLTLLRKKKRSR